MPKKTEMNTKAVPKPKAAQAPTFDKELFKRSVV